MLTIRKSNERGSADHGWLKSKHTFSFADYYDPKNMGFGPLRVINEDYIAAENGFGMHGHRDMEIISYVTEGALSHQDSAGNKADILPGEVQRMSAGAGIMHSEYNHSKDKRVHLFQIWIIPNKFGVPFSYGQKSFEKELKEKKLVLVVSEDGRDGSISINQDADLYISRLKENDSLDFSNVAGRKIWLQLIKGSINVNGESIEVGDAISTDDVNKLNIKSRTDAEFMIFDMK